MTRPAGQKSWDAFALEVGDAWVACSELQLRREGGLPAAAAVHNFAEEPPLSPEEEETLF